MNKTCFGLTHPLIYLVVSNDFSQSENVIYVFKKKKQKNSELLKKS